MQGRGGVAVLARLAAGVLAQYPLKLWRTDALLTLVACSSVLAQEHLLVANVSCERRQTERASERGKRESEGIAEVRRMRESGIKRARQSDRVTGGERMVGV